MNSIPTFIPVDKAQDILAERIQPLPVVTVDLDEAVGLTLAEDIACDTDVPIFDRSIMDGYAVRAGDVSQPPTVLRVAGRSLAGRAPTAPVTPGCAVQINTGAPIPSGADAVVKVEDTTLSEDGNQVTITQAAEPKQHISFQGSFVSKGDVVLAAGTRLNPAKIAVAATAGAHKLRGYSVPKINLLVTGDEIISPTGKPTGAQIRDANGPQLAALIRESLPSSPIVPQVNRLGIVGDDRGALEKAIRSGLQGDVLCITGGISMGTHDLVPQILKDCGVTICFQKMSIKPARPTLFGMTENNSLVFGLPGNPVSTFIGFWLIMRPALFALQGRPIEPPTTLGATLTAYHHPDSGRQTYWPAKVAVDDAGSMHVKPLSWGGSGDPFGLTEANGFIVRKPHARAAEAGEMVDIILIEPL